MKDAIKFYYLSKKSVIDATWILWKLGGLEDPRAEAGTSP